MSLPRYVEYKDSGIRWLGSVPRHWKMRRYKNVFVEREERSSEGSETLLSVSAYTGVTPRADIIDEGEHLSRAESLEGYKICYPSDLVMNIMLAWNRGLGISRFNGIVSPAYSVFRIQSGDESRFLDYMVRSDRITLYYKAFSAGVVDSRLRLYPDTFGSLYCALPPPDEQSLIADFLDRETAKIDALIAEQEKLLALLAEKRQATISHAVTRGLDPNVPMKDSGIPWLGNIPARWEVLPLKRDLAFLTSGSRGWAEHYADEGALFLRIGNLTRDDVELDLSDIQRVAPPEGSEGERTRVESGDILFSITAYLGSVAVVPEALEVAYVSQHVALARLHGRRFLPKWVAYATLSRLGTTYLANQGYGGTKVQLSLDDIACLPVTAPPLDEQRETLALLERELRKFESIRMDCVTAVGLLRERRSALIAAAVTGQIDVRGAVREAQAA